MLKKKASHDSAKNKVKRTITSSPSVANVPIQSSTRTYTSIPTQQKAKPTPYSQSTLRKSASQFSLVSLNSIVSLVRDEHVSFRKQKNTIVSLLQKDCRLARAQKEVGVCIGESLIKEEKFRQRLEKYAETEYA